MVLIAGELSKIQYGDEIIEFQISRLESLERKILIHVEPSGQVIVEAPSGAQQNVINSAIRKRVRWVLRQQKHLQDYKIYTTPRTYISGETHFYLGRRYVLKVMSSVEKAPFVKMHRGTIIVTTEGQNPEKIKAVLAKWYRDHALDYFLRRVDQIAEKMSWLDKKPTIRLLKMRKQWGSCSSNGTVILNPSLIKAPRECIDYVILHEICHLKEHNHSSRFYGLLSRHMQDWKIYKNKLDAMAEMLLIDETFT